MKRCEPFRTYSSPSSLASERMAAASEPEPGSVSAYAGSRSPLARASGDRPPSASSVTSLLIASEPSSLESEDRGRSSRRPAGSPRWRRGPSASPSRSRRSAPPRREARGSRARGAARPCPRGTRPTRRSRPPAGRAPARASGRLADLALLVGERLVTHAESLFAPVEIPDGERDARNHVREGLRAVDVDAPRGGEGCPALVGDHATA